MTVFTTLRHAARAIGRSPLFAVTAIGSLAIGIAASTTIFSLVDGLFLRPRPGMVDESRVVDVGRATDGDGFDNFGYQVFLALSQATTIEGLAGYRFGANPISLDNGRGGSERAYATPVTANYFAVLGTRAAAGRLFAGDEDRVPDQAPIAVLTHAFWQRRFGGDAAIVGSTLGVNGRPYTIIGVAEPGFEGTTISGTDLWVPFAMAPHVTGRPSGELLTGHGAVWHIALARMKPGVAAAQVRDELNALLAPVKAEHPREYGRWSMEVLPSARVPGEFRTAVAGFVAVLFGLTGLVLAIACSNVTGMLLARALARRREIATRLAVGAGRGQVVTQLLLETCLLFAAAALGSALLTWWMVAFVESFMPALPVPLAIDLTVDARVLAFAVTLAFVTALVFGLAPALRATRMDIAHALHGQHSTADGRRMRTRHVLVAAQVALSLVLLVTTGLLVRALQQAGTVDTGYDGSRVRIFTVDTSLTGAQGQQAAALAGRLLDRVRAIGGVETVATTNVIPLQGGRFGFGGLRVPGYRGPRGDEQLPADWAVVSPAYFDALDLAIKAGRAFTDDDRDGRPYVAIVNEVFAARAWPGEDPVGRVIYQSTSRDTFDRPVTIVGVARTAKYASLGEASTAFIYVPLAQQPITEMHLLVRHAAGWQAWEDVSRAIAEVAPALPVITSSSFDEATGLGLLPQRLAASIAGGVGVVGLLLSALGLYGLMAFHAVQRTREVAVRMALGATSRQVLRLMLAQAAKVGGAGGVVGLALAGGAAMGVRGLLVGVQPFDAVAFGTAVAVLVATLVGASWLPARRAAATDPAAALRAE